MAISISRYNRFLLLLPCLWLAAGCQSQPKGPPPPLATPSVFTQVSHYTGTPLSGPRVAVADVGSPADALDISVKWIAVAAPPPNVQETLSSQCRLIIAGQSGAPMLASPELTKGVLLDQSSDVASLESQYAGPASTDFAPVATLEGALPAKVTASFIAATSAGPLPRDRLIIRVARSDAATAATHSTNRLLELTLEISQDNSPSTTQPSIAKSETAVFDRSLVDGRDRLAIVIPMKFSDSPARALVALIDITPTTSAALLARCHADLQSSAATAAKQPNVAAVEGSAWSGYDSALKALWRPADRRAALVFLAAQTSAHICEDTALVADDPTLEKLASTIAQQAAASSEPHTAAALSWLLDRAAFQLLVLGDAPASSAAGNKSSGNSTVSAPLPPELRAVLTVYAGEPARHSGSLDDIANQATSRQDLENRLTAENLVFLTDASPASRVRAFDWLKARGLAPAGFDPLGPPKQRREALDKLLSASD
jgi:hypothetical protein